MGEPNIFTGPIAPLGILYRAFAKHLQAKAIFVFGFSQVGMEVDQGVLPRNFNRLPHQIRCHAEGRAWSQTNSHHRERFRIVEGFDGPDAIFDDLRLGVTYPVGGQTTLAFAQAHAAAGGVKSDSNLLRCPNLVIDFAAVGIQIEVVSHGGTATQNEFTKTDFGTHIDRFGSHLGPDGVEKLKPIKQNHTRASPNRPGQGLIQVVVTVDQPRHDHAAAGIDDLVNTVTSQLGPVSSKPGL